MTPNHKALTSISLVFFILFTIITYLEYSYRVGFVEINHSYHSDRIGILNVKASLDAGVTWYFLHDFYYFISAVVRLAAMAFCWMLWKLVGPIVRNKEQWQKKVPFFGGLLAISGLTFLIGYPLTNFLNIFVFPASWLLAVWSIYYLSKTTLGIQDEKHPLDTLPKAKHRGAMSFSIDTLKGLLTFPHLNHGTFTLGLPGYGKTASGILPRQHENICNGGAAFIYDFKGDKLPLGTAAYNSYLYGLSQLNALSKVKRYLRKTFQQKGKVAKFNLFSFFHITQSVRLNPFAPRYIPTKLRAGQLALTFFKNLDEEFVKKKDFWNKNGVLLLTNLIYTVSRVEPQFSTIPHIISLLCMDIKDVCQMLIKMDPQVKGNMRPIITAWENDAKQQLSGVEASASLPFLQMRIKELFWLFSSDDVNLNINEPEDPQILVITSRKAENDALKPVNALVADVVSNLINADKRVPCHFEIDEIDTIFINDIHALPATGRENKIMFDIAAQSLQQLSLRYGKDAAAVLWESTGNKVIFRCMDQKLGKEFSEGVGTYVKYNQNFSTNIGDRGKTVSDNYKEEPILKYSDITQLEIGECVGMVSGIKKPYFKTQVKEYKLHEELGLMDKSEMQQPPRVWSSDISDSEVEEILEKHYQKILNDCDQLMERYLQHT